MTTQTDERGRLYLPKELREEYGDRFHVVRYQGRIELVPVASDPLSALRDAVGDALDGLSPRELRADAREQAIADAIEDVRRD